MIICEQDELNELAKRNLAIYSQTISDLERSYLQDFSSNKVEPLRQRMHRCNLDLYIRLRQIYEDQFPPTEFDASFMNIRASIARQKKDFGLLLDEIREVALNFHKSKTMEDGLFQICHNLLSYAIEYDFPEHALETIHLMQNPEIVGEENSKFNAVEAIKGVSKSYIKRYVHESSFYKVERVDLKTSIRNMINAALAGLYGDAKDMTIENLRPVGFPKIFDTIYSEAQSKQNKVANNTGKKA